MSDGMGEGGRLRGGGDFERREHHPSWDSRQIVCEKQERGTNDLENTQ